MTKQTFNNSIPVKGKKGFESPYGEKRGELISIRLPKSLDEKVRAIVGWEDKDDNPKLKLWLEKLIEDAVNSK